MNIVFLLVFLKVPTRTVASYKAFSLYTNAQDLLSAVIFALTTPRFFATDFAFIYIAVGPVYQWKWTQLLLLLWTCTFMSSIVIVTNNFIFQYVQICKKYLRLLYSTGQNILRTLDIRGPNITHLLFTLKNVADDSALVTLEAGISSISYYTLTRISRS
ncbi:hypothetical protein Y032_0066g3740 [Ancylostoma ceylanicum]|nr:hypothetical protein Y032_0066g3740 [Ancylostoma ceylanicum]